jgi:hypothetical protein
VDSTDTQREADQEEISTSKEAETMAVHPTLPNSKTNKKTTPEGTHRKVSSLRKRCMVDKTEVAAAMVAAATEDMAAVVDIETAAKEEKADTEIVVVNVTEVATVAMVEVAASNIQVLRFLLCRKVKVLTCFRIISVLKQTHRQETFSFTRLILVFSTTQETETLA